MRVVPFLLGSALIASPALAQQPAPQPQRAEEIQIPRELSDPAIADRLSDMMQVLSKALLNLPVGELQAAAEGRQPTAEEKRLTVRDAGRRDDPNFEQNLERQIAESRPAMRAGVKALVSALPAMMRAMSGVQDELERATANIPRPDYPKR